MCNGAEGGGECTRCGTFAELRTARTLLDLGVKLDGGQDEVYGMLAEHHIV